MLGRFCSGRRLTSLWSNRSKRFLVLKRLALEFEAGIRYQEREVTSHSRCSIPTMQRCAATWSTKVS